MLEQMKKPAHLKPVLRTKRRHCSEKPITPTKIALLAAIKESPQAATKTVQPKRNI